MNFVDLTILLIIILILASYKKLSFVFYVCTSVGAFIGFLVALYVAPLLVSNFETNLQRGIVELATAGVCTVLGYIAGRYIGNKLRIKLLSTKWYSADKFLAFPYKIFAAFVMIVVLAQTLIHVPILSVQYLAQGSSILFATNKMIPELFIANQAAKVAPYQFQDVMPDYDKDPLTYNNIQDAGEWQQVIDRVAPSVVKISGRTCNGLDFGSGFIAAPHYVVTNAHVVRGASTIYVSDHNGTYPATPVAVEPEHDLAVLYVKFIKGDPLPILNQHVGLDVESAVLGYPGGGDLRLSKGATVDPSTVRSTDTKLTSNDLILMTARVAGGNSGGPAINANGQVMGVVAASRQGQAIAIQPMLAVNILQKAKNKLTPTSTKLCEVGSKYF